jgi:formyltetrahydrofolate-dependent phosphoribosylglycinamide formyltransferase
VTQSITIYTDGGSRGNPGPAAAGFLLEGENKKTLQAKGLFLGQATNNFAEYTAVIKALEAAAELGAEKVTLYSDSQLLVRQINGQYKLKSENLKPLFAQAMEILSTIPAWKIIHIPREKNTKADKLVNDALDIGADVIEIQQKKTKPIKIAVLISGGGTTLINILEKINQGCINARVPLVISSLSKAKGVKRAKNAGLKVEIIRKKDCPDIEAFSKKIEDQLVAADVDLVVQGGWLCLWNIPDRYENRVMNIHPALLPSFGGKGMWGHHVHEAVIKSGAKISGCTVHFCTNEYDKGPIIVQRSCPVKEGDTPEALADRVFEQECIAYPEAIKLFAEGKITVENNIVKINP